MIIKKEEPPVIEPKNIFIGNSKAPVTLMEFADYETTGAIEAHEIVKEILHSYDGKVKFSFRHFPLVHYHQRAHKAAEAAIAAAQEGKFIEMHEKLLNNRRNLGTTTLKSHARDIGVMNKSFLDDLINGKYGWFVQDDLSEGIRMGVKELPAFFINGKKLTGEITLENVKKQIEAALKN